MKPLRAAVAGLALVGLAGLAQAAPPLAQDRDLSDGIDRTVHDYSGEGDASQGAASNRRNRLPSRSSG